MPADQNRELHQAFFSGALVAMAEINQASKLPEDAACKRIGALMAETQQILQYRVTTLKQQN